MTPEAESYVIPVPFTRCDRTSAAEGPVYVNVPVASVYVRDPSPPASVTDTDSLALLFVKSESAIAVVNDPPPAMLIVNIPDDESNVVEETEPVPAIVAVPTESICP